MGRAIVVLLGAFASCHALAACSSSGASTKASGRAPFAGAGASASTGEPAAPGSEPGAPTEALDVPRPEGIGPLVPWMPASAWTGKGAPPKQFSLFAVPERSPVLGYAALERDACEAELGRRGIGFARAEETAGVRAPIRLTGSLRGVSLHSMVPPAMRAKSRAELVDCRLALSLDDFAATLAARGITEVTWFSAYRSKNEGGCTVKYPGEQHCAALAVDVASFTKKDGTKLVVERDFHGKIGTLTCVSGEPPKNELWSIACDAAGKHFQVVLTPNWNAEHHNHFHLELTVHEWVLAR
ncbi:MAG: extensin family protein [Deltaproteobacteria bacterium]|nr:extensin family protein [Deltaproteobacteria bacterium]